MSFKTAVSDDIKNVFLNLSEYAEKRTILYDGETYTDIPIVLTGLKEQDRRQLASDHAQGLYQITSVLHCSLADLDDVQPEKGKPIKINDEEGGEGFFRTYYVGTSTCEMGMLR